MSRIEELSDEPDQGVDVDSTSHNGEQTLDELFDRAMARGGFTDKTFEEAMADISKTPLFMTDLADAADDKEANDMLEAIKALQYEGTIAEIAQNFKESGNECVQSKRWTDAREFYTKGLAVVTGHGNGKWDEPEDLQEELKQRKILTEQLYVNRARCNLELGNYRMTTLDCAAALRLNPMNIKAHFRSASALFALDKVYEALDVCYRGLKLDDENQPMKVLLDKIQKRSRIKEAQDRKRKAEQNRTKKEKLMLDTALRARNIKLRGSEKALDLMDAAIRLAPDPLSPKSMLEFPVMLLYPMHNQSDFIKAYAEKEALIDHLGYILPLPWDSQREYQLDQVDCYMDTLSGGLLKVGKKLTLLEMLSNGKTEVVDGLVRIHVVPRSLAPSWIEEVKRKKGK